MLRHAMVGMGAWALAGLMSGLVPGAASAAPSTDLLDAEEEAPPLNHGRVMPEIETDIPLDLESTLPFGAAVGDEAVAPEVFYDADALPTPVRRLREQILDAATSGDPERLRPIIEANGEPPAFSYNDIGDDPIAYLRSLSNDPEGREILAVLAEMLEAGFVHVGEGTADEMYVWPYFAHYPVQLLTGPQIVELLKIVYPGDYEDMKVYGTYLSYRIGLAPDGTWRYFLTSE